jgi:hypothetical protein
MTLNRKAGKKAAPLVKPLRLLAQRLESGEISTARFLELVILRLREPSAGLVKVPDAKHFLIYLVNVRGLDKTQVVAALEEYAGLVHMKHNTGHFFRSRGNTTPRILNTTNNPEALLLELRVKFPEPDTLPSEKQSSRTLFDASIRGSTARASIYAKSRK